MMSAAAVDWSMIRSVLLIRLRSIGDTVLMTPCLAAPLRFNRPLHDVKLTAVNNQPRPQAVIDSVRVRPADLPRIDPGRPGPKPKKEAPQLKLTERTRRGDTP